MDFNTLYSKHYKLLILIPLIILAIDFAIIGMNYQRSGSFINKDVSLQGGTTATIYSDTDFGTLESLLKEKFPESDISIKHLSEFGTDKQIGVIIEATNLKSDDLKKAIEQEYKIALTQDNFSIEEMGSALGESFFKQMTVAMALAFLFMAITVFVIFRNLVPSTAVVVTAFTDIITTIAVLDLAGMKVSAAGIASLLMLIGYSVDTDMLLTTKVLKRKEGAAINRMKEAIITGLTMTTATLAALVVALPISQSQVLKEMFIILIIGLVIDIFATYCFNAGMLVWYLKKRQTY